VQGRFYKFRTGVFKIKIGTQDANKLLDSTSQPHELLVSAVRGRDEELRSTRAETDRLKTVLAAVQGERNKLREQCAQLKSDIEQVLSRCSLFPNPVMLSFWFMYRRLLFVRSSSSCVLYPQRERVILAGSLFALCFSCVTLSRAAHPLRTCSHFPCPVSLSLFTHTHC